MPAVPGVERFGQVVVRAHFKAHDAVDFFRLGREHDDGRVVVATAQPTTDGQAIFAGQHQIQHEQVEMLALPEFAHLFGVFGNENVESLLGQIPAQQIAQARIIVDDEDFSGGGGVLRIHGRKCNSDENQRLVGVHKILHIANHG